MRCLEPVMPSTMQSLQALKREKIAAAARAFAKAKAEGKIEVVTASRP